MKVIPHFFFGQVRMELIDATRLATASKWRGVRMTPMIARQIDQIWNEASGKARQEMWSARREEWELESSGSDSKTVT